jgi:hypothetical protein
MSRPPPGRGRARSAALWALAMPWTMVSPSPCPSVWRIRSLPSYWNGSNSRASPSGGISIPVLLTAITARPASCAVEISTRPPATLCRRALSSRFATRLSASLGSPEAGAAVSDPGWHRLLERVAPTSAGLAIQATTGLRGQPLSPWAGLGVLAAWAFAVLLADGLRPGLSDA